MWREPTVEEVLKIMRAMCVLADPKKKLVESHIEKNEDKHSYSRFDVYEDEHGNKAGHIFGARLIVPKIQVGKERRDERAR